MLRISRYSDLVLAVFVVSVTTMLLIPLPTLVLDILLVLNIAFSILLLLVGVYTQNALALLALPTLLLLSTLFRLALNVASTRLILSQGYAGQVIDAFGSFLIRGEVVVGVIIFAIITVVNFYVIARGAGRVSEVAARFALDALPGKQMSIDADMRSGNITAQEARRRRDDLRKESQLYGAMDGSMKFVQGDAVAGFFIIITNIVGGLYLGISGGLGFAEAVDRYTRLTVGDGLVTQIPAILTSICAGVVVTRVSSGENTSLGSDLGAQLFGRPTTVFFAGFLLLFIGLLPGLPKGPFILVAGAFFVLGFALRARERNFSGEILPVAKELGVVPRGLLGMTGAVSESGSDESPVIIALDAAVLYPSYLEGSSRYRQFWGTLREDFAEFVGVDLPPLRVIPDAQLLPAHYAVLSRGSKALAGSVLLDSVLVEVNPENADAFGLEVALPTEHPVNRSRVFWASNSPMLNRLLSAAKIGGYDFMEYILLKTVVFFREHPEEALTLTHVHSAVKVMENQYPGLLAEAFGGDFISTARLTEVMQELVRQGVAVKEFKQLVELIASYCSTQGAALVQAREFNLDDLVAYIRLNRRRQLIGNLTSDRGTIRAVKLAADVERIFEDAPADSSRQSIVLEPVDQQRLRAGLMVVVDQLRSRGCQPFVVLCREEIRYGVLKFIRSLQEPMAIVTIEELEPGTPVELAGTWRG